MKKRTFALFALAAALLAGGCGNTPTAATTTTTGQTVVFTSILVPKGADSHVFTLTQSGPISITMSNVPATIVGLGYGIPNSSSPLGCSLTTSVVANSDTNAQIVSSADAGTYCLEVFDVGQLTVPVSFYVTLVSGTPTATATTAVTPTTTEDFPGTLGIGGTVVYPFTVSLSGVATATLVSVTGDKVPATVSLNVGIGTYDGVTCTPIVASNVQVGSAGVTTTLSAGPSCVQVADVGNLVNPATFDITIVHP